MHENFEGKLFSIDAPNSDSDWWVKHPITQLPEGKDVGWAVPPRLKARWELVLGKSKETMPPLLEKIGGIEMFLHDSEHTPENMLFEYDLAYRHLRHGGVLLSDDFAMAEGEFERFCAKVGEEAITERFSRMGAMRKTAS